MGYRTVQSVPTVRAYEEAKRIHDNIKPIRGNPNNVRPLGDRRDWQMYSVRMNGDAVEFVCYKTPVVTFHPGDKIVVRTGGWDTVSTRQFIWQVLNLPCGGHRGRTLLHVGGSHRVVLTDAGMRLKVSGGVIMLDQEVPKLRGYKVDRKAANNVRARYKDFYTYLKGFVSLRETQAEHRGKEYGIVSTTMGELIDVVGLTQDHKDARYCYVNSRELTSIMKRPPEVHSHWRKHDNFDETYEKVGNKFMQMISSSDHADHYKTALMLLSMHSTNWVNVETVEKERSRMISVASSELLNRLDNIVMRWHAHEVLVEYDLPEGKMPNPKYVNWFDKE